ncbi:hypothetical protein M3J09_003067 [Ascochyta lentis]
MVFRESASSTCPAYRAPTRCASLAHVPNAGRTMMCSQDGDPALVQLLPAALLSSTSRPQGVAEAAVLPALWTTWASPLLTSATSSQRLPVERHQALNSSQALHRMTTS